MIKGESFQIPITPNPTPIPTITYESPSATISNNQVEIEMVNIRTNENEDKGNEITVSKPEIITTVKPNEKSKFKKWFCCF
jgi:hypothetical protein